MAEEQNPFLIPPPPPGMPAAAPVAPPTAAEPDPASYITLPPDVVESATHKLPVQRAAAPEPAPPVVAPATAETPVAADTVVSVLKHAAPAWQLVLPGGVRLPLEGSVVLGRNPSSPDDRPDAVPIALHDTTKSVSKTHALLALEGGALWLHDLHSTNGVVVVTDAGRRRVAAGAQVSVPPGATIELGNFAVRVELV